MAAVVQLPSSRLIEDASPTRAAVDRDGGAPLAEPRGEFLEWKIEFCKQCLRKGVDANAAATLVIEQLEAEIELEQLRRSTPKLICCA